MSKFDTLKDYEEHVTRSECDFIDDGKATLLEIIERREREGKINVRF